MTNLENGWQTTSSGELCEYITSGSRDWRSYYCDEGALFIRTQDINQDRLDLSHVARVSLPSKIEGKRSRVQSADLLVTITGANVGRVALVPDGIQEAYVSQSVGLMRLKDKRIAPYLHYYLQSDQTGRKHVMDMVYGIGRPVLSLKNLREIPIRLPPLEQQKCIIAEIEKQFTRLDAGVASLKHVRAALKQFRASVLKAACEGTLVSTEATLAHKENRNYESGAQLLQRMLKERREKWSGKGKYKEPVGAKVTELPAVPEGWAWTTISQLTVDSVIGLDRGRAQQSADPEAGVPYIKMNNVTSDGRITYDKLSYVPARPDEKKRFVVREGDVLFNTRNSKELVGKVGLVQNPPPSAIYNNNMRIRFSEDVSPAFLNLQMISNEFRRRMELVKKATTNVAAVYAKDLFPLPVALPPCAEQCRIVAEVEAKLSIVDELEMMATSQFRRVTRLRQSILQQAFEGKLTGKNNILD